MNSFSSEISQRYALALYDLSKENNQTEEFVANIKGFMKVFNSNESLRFFIKNPTYSVEDQKSVFNKILAQMNMNKMVKNFFLLLIIKKRIFFVDQIAEKFLNIISIKKGELSLNIVSANKLEEKEILYLEKEISSNLKNKLNKYKKSMMEN